MAEAAPNPYDEASDEQDSPEARRARLKAIEGGGETSEPDRSWYKGSGSDEDSEPDVDNSDSPDKDSSGLLRDLADSEALGNSFTYTGTEQIFKGRTKASDIGKNGGKDVGFIRRQFGKHNRAFLIGGTATFVIVAAIFIFITLAPLKILTIVNKLQDRFYASSQIAVQNESGVLFSDYMKKYVMPALRRCPGDVSRSCNPIEGSSMLSQLYRGWRYAKLEDKLEKNYHIAIKYSQGSGRYYLKAPGLTGDGVDLGTEDSPNGFMKSSDSLDQFLSKSNDPEFKRVSRSQLRQAVKDSFANETKWKQVFYRFKAGSLLSKKYGIKRCIIACSKSDNFGDWKDNKIRAAKLIFSQRVLAPRSTMLGVVVTCIVDGCDSTQVTSDGEKQTVFDARVQQQLDQAAAEYGEESVADMIKTANDISSKGFQKYAIDKVMGALIGKFYENGGDQAAAEATQAAASDVASKALPVAGWINMAAKLVKFGSNVGPDVKRYGYVVNAATMVNTYMIYRVFADEMKTGHVDPAIVGSFIDSLGPGNSTTSGGTADAEATPLYAELIDNQSASGASTSALNLLSGSVYAAGTSNNLRYTCNNKKPPPAGKPVCPEDVLGGGNSVTNSISSFFNSPGMKPVVYLSTLWNASAGKVINGISKLFGGVISKFPGFNSLASLVAGAASPLIHAIVEQVVPSIASDNPSGGQNFVLAAGGSDVSGNDYCHSGLGCEALTPVQAGYIYNQQNQEALQSFKNESLAGRLFDTTSDYSLATKVAMAMPNNLSSASQSVASIFSNPFGRLGDIFSSLFSPGRAFAAAPAQADPFGVTQYGYPDNDPNLAAANADPEQYWMDNCSSDGVNIDWSKPANAAWEKNQDTDPGSGVSRNTQTDPCLLIQAAVGSAGAIYDSGLLTSDDLSDNTATGSISETGSATVSGNITPVSGTAQQLAKQILNNPKISKSGKLVSEDLQDTANGQPGSSGQPLSAAILRLIATLGQSHSFDISALESGGTGHTNNSQHYSGDAVDIDVLDSKPLTGRDPGSVSIINLATGILPQGSGFGQQGCGPPVNLPAGFTEFSDTCNHLHIQVPDGTP